MTEMILTHFKWVEQRFFEHAPQVEQAAETPEKSHEIIKLWLIWCERMGFLKTLSLKDSDEPVACIIARPIDSDKVDRYRDHYLDTIFEFDKEADTLLVDFVYGPGHIRALIKLMKMSGLSHTLWYHNKTGETYLEPIDRLKPITR